MQDLRRGELQMQIKVIHAKPQVASRKKRVCAYARVSTDTIEQEGSLENQEIYYENLITSNPEYEFVKVYTDQGISGFKEKRPGFQAMLEEARKGRIDLIITKSISRFARNTATVLKFTRELKSMGVGIFFELQNINTLSSDGEFMLTVLAAFAQAESEGASLNTKMTYRRKFEQGIPSLFPSRILGYDLDEYGDLVINLEQAEIVRLIYELALKEIWPSKIKNYLNHHGIKTITGKDFVDTGVFRILRNEMYKGDLRLQKTYTDSNRRTRRNAGQVDSWYIEDDHPAIVTKEEWEQVQNILAKRSSQLKEPPKIKKQSSSYSRNTYPLSGLLFCPKCGEVLHHKVSNNKQKTVYWACSTNLKKSKAACSGIWIPEQITDHWTISEKSIVLERTDEFGSKCYTYTSKEQYDRRKLSKTNKED